MAPYVADVVWPALVLERRMLSILPILFGLVFEAAVLRYGFPMPWEKAVLVDVVMNGISTVAGILLLPLAGFLWEFFPGLLLEKLFKMGTFNPYTWAATCLLAMFLSTGIETAVVRWIFQYIISAKRFWLIAFANLGSVAIAFISLLIHPPRL